MLRGRMPYGSAHVEHDARNEIVLEVENLVRIERTFVRFAPQLGARRRVRQLDRHAQARSSLPDAAVEHVPSRFLAGASPDDTQIAEARQAGIDFCGQALREAGQTGLRAAEGEWCDRHPETLVSCPRDGLRYGSGSALELLQCRRE